MTFLSQKIELHCNTEIKDTTESFMLQLSKLSIVEQLGLLGKEPYKELFNLREFFSWCVALKMVHPRHYRIRKYGCLNCAYPYSIQIFYGHSMNKNVSYGNTINVYLVYQMSINRR